MTKAQYSETQLSDDDASGKVLDALADGLPYVLITVKILPDGQLDLAVQVGNGIADVETVRNVVSKVLRNLPDEGVTDG